MTYGMLNYVLGCRCIFNMNTFDDDEDLKDSLIICVVARVVDIFYLFKICPQNSVYEFFPNR
ncbi:hypothetical protein C1H46_032635 [Malus baccata]|uniref:Uncharacterized protein n=1 Tax=Malus baccata TaxID=106549 RepID=A0A540L5S8_MALBA|nr:hypothetical protein C1H46_032635 [Malus baccata]